MGNQRLQHPTMIIKASFNITYTYQRALHSGNLRKKDFMMKREDYSKNKVGQREYLNHAKTDDLTRKLYQRFESTVEIERMRHGKHARA